MTSLQQGDCDAIVCAPQLVELVVERGDDLHVGCHQNVLVVSYDGRIGPIGRTADQQG